MKKLLFLALLASCTNAPAGDPVQKTVSDYLRRTLDDPSSYQPVSWHEVRPYIQSDAKERQVKNLQEMAVYAAHLAADHAEQVYKLTGVTDDLGKKLSLQNRLLSDKYSRQGDSISKAAVALQTSTPADTTRLGSMITHVFRAKNKAGGLVLDSARFIVLKSGAVTREVLD